MKRDMNLIRLVLLAVQDDAQFNGSAAGYTDDQIKYHQALAIEKGLLKGKVLKYSDDDGDIPGAVHVQGLTWDGHDFVDAIASDANWIKVKVFLLDGGKQLTIETVKSAIQSLFGA